MSAPPGFSEHNTVLPPGPPAPIHAMHGGGGDVTSQVGGVTKSYSIDDLQILESYGLTENTLAPYIEGFDDSFKDEFLKQIRSGNCEKKGNSITKKDCWAVSAVIRATMRANFAQGNARKLPGMISNGENPNETTDTIDSASNLETELSEDIRGMLNEEEMDAGEPAPCIRENQGPDIVTDENEATAILTAPLPGEPSEENINRLLQSFNDESSENGNGDSSEGMPLNSSEVVVGMEPPGTDFTPVVPPMPLGRGPVAPNNSAYFEENPANFRKGQYGMNINTANDSKRFYSNAVLGTKRLRIRGRNATNIKSKYNTKKQKLVAEADRLRAARNIASAAAAAEQTQKQAAKNAAKTEAIMAEMMAKQRRAAATATSKEYNVTRKSQERIAKAEQESIRRAEVAAGIQKQSFMNRMRGVKNPFKRGGSRKTRKTRRKNRR